LYEKVCKFSSYLKKLNLKKGDRVAAYVPNKIESIVCFLACAKNGIIWSSCSPDFGVPGVIERFSQNKPKLLIITDKYYYNGKEINIIERLPKILKKIKSIKSVLILNYPGKKLRKLKKIKNVKIYYFTEIKKLEISIEKLKKFDFDHELAILYSSGTTGKPKCICHRSGGVLLQHLKEHQLHCNIKDGDRVFYFTTCGWMMWNWLVSGLLLKSTIYLYDGSPFYPNAEVLWNFVDSEKINFMGVSAKYIDALSKENL